MKMPRLLNNNKKYAPVLVLPLLIVAVFFLLFRPAYLNLNRIKKEVAAKKTELGAGNSVLAEAESVTNQLRVLEEKAVFYQSYFAPMKETEILRELARVANRSDLYYDKLTPAAAGKKEPAAAVGGNLSKSAVNAAAQAPFSTRDFNLSFQASYTQLSQLLSRLEKLGNFVTVRTFKIDASEDSYNPKAELTLTFYSR